MKNVNVVEVTLDIDVAFNSKVSKFLTSLGLEKNAEQVSSSSVTTEYSAHDVGMPFKEMAILIEDEFPELETEIEDNYDDGEYSDVEHFSSALIVTN